MIAIPRSTPAILAWIGVAAHLVVGVVALRRSTALATDPLLPSLPLVPLLNVAVAACVLAYWAHAWYGYMARGVTWYASDQLVPLYATAVAIVGGLALAGRYDGRLAHGFQWVVFAIDALALVGAALYLTFMRFNRLF
jgi:hypothetical protein